MLSSLVSATSRADAPREELTSASAALAGYTLTTSAMVALAAIPIVRCNKDLACLGTAFLSIGTFVLAHPFVSAAGVHWLTAKAGDRQPYWHSLVGQAVGDGLAVTALILGAKLAPERPLEGRKRRVRALIFTACALLSAAGPLAIRPLLDTSRARPANMQLALSF